MCMKSQIFLWPTKMKINISDAKIKFHTTFYAILFLEHLWHIILGIVQSKAFSIIIEKLRNVHESFILKVFHNTSLPHFIPKLRSVG